MEKKSFKIDFWHWFGIIAFFGLALYTSFLLYDYLYTLKLPKVSVEGNYSRYENPFEGIKPNRVTEIITIDSIRKILGNCPQKDIASAQIYYLVYQTVKENYRSQFGKYKTFWEFTITNRSEKNITRAYLQLPFEGIYRIMRQNEWEEIREFRHRIFPEIIYAGEKLKIYVWTTEPLSDYIGYLKEKTFFEYYGGAIDVVYPVQVRGLLAWNIKLQNKPALILAAIIVLFLAIIIVVFYNLGAKSAMEEIINEEIDMANIKAEEENPPHSTS